MGDMLSQAEIDALLGDDKKDASEGNENDSAAASVGLDILSSEEKDILGELGNISMGTAATTLFALLNQKVNITTPKVSVFSWKDLANRYDRPCVGIKVGYKEGLIGANVLVLKQHDVKIIADLMMGGSGEVDDTTPLSELDLSAIAEAMNQMVGSSATSLSSMLNMKIDIDTPNAFILDFNDDSFFEQLGFEEDPIVATCFRMEVGTLIDSEIMQILPVGFALDMVNSLRNGSAMGGGETVDETPAPAPEPTPAPAPQPAPEPMPQAQPEPQMYQQPPQMDPQQMYQQPMYQQPMYQQPQQMYQQPMYQQMPQQPMYQQPQANVNVQPAQFQSFDVSAVMQQKENIGIIMDVPLEVTVELGRTHKLIKEILEFSPGTIVELDKLAGEPIDILVNGKHIAKGEVVVIDENFGVRITDIVSVEDRI